MRDRERQRHRQREKQAPHGEPDVRLDLRTLGSRPELKADAQLLSHPGIRQTEVSLINVCSHLFNSSKQLPRNMSR